MKIGIITFHWATNYGAVLQCYALQKSLEDIGHNVEIINYKPTLYNDSLYRFFRNRKFLHLKEYIFQRKQEKALEEFRKSNLNQSRRVCSCNEISDLASKYDAIISGSDQIMNPYFLMNGEGHGIISPSYFLGFTFSGKRIGYALSFGCVYYPEIECKIASKYIERFNKISVRESTGISIMESMGWKGAVIVPDPTILLGSTYYQSLAGEKPLSLYQESVYIYCFFIRNIKERKIEINSIINKNIIWNNEDNNFTMQSWLNKIMYSKYIITDSFHCMVMCLKLHRPFVVVTDKCGNIGMNDRFYTLLKKMNLDYRIIHKSKLNYLLSIIRTKINWCSVDKVLDEYIYIGMNFLNNI